MSASGLKVLQVTREVGSDKRYGLGRAVALLAEGLVSAGIGVDIFCAGDLPSSAVAAATARARRWTAASGGACGPLFESISRAWETGHRAAAVAARGGHSHVNCHDPVVAHGYLQATAGKSAAPVGIAQHGFHSLAVWIERFLQPLPEPVRSGVVRLESEAFAQAQWAVFPSRLGAAQVVRELGLPAMPSHWHVVPHGRPGWEALPRRLARQRLGWPEDDGAAVLLAVGQLIPLKRFEWVIRAFAGAPGNWSLVVLGDGDDAALREAARRAGVEHRLRIASTDDPRPYYAAADVFTSASSTEAFGMAHLEALTMGLPVVCTAVGGVPDVVAGGGLMTPDDEAAYAAALRQVLRDAVLRERLAQQARARIVACPDVVEVGRLQAAIHRAVTSQPPHASSRPAGTEPFSSSCRI